MSEHDTDFDWSPLGEQFWRSAAESCAHKPTEQQIRFACLKHSGLNASDAAARSGYEGDETAIRVAGHRASKSTAVAELLAYAHAETGKGDDGIVSGKEAKRILSRIARKGNNNERVKALESLSRLAEEERRRSEQTEETDYVEELYLLARSISRDAVGAITGLAHYFTAAGHIIGHPFLKEVAPIAAKRFTDDWQYYRSKHSPSEIAQLDKLADGPLLDGDELVAAIAAKRPRVATIKAGAVDAA